MKYSKMYYVLARIYIITMALSAVLNGLYLADIVNDVFFYVGSSVVMFANVLLAVVNLLRINKKEDFYVDEKNKWSPAKANIYIAVIIFVAVAWGATYVFGMLKK